jgi:hypothetical protein
MEDFYACLYYAALRPLEALKLRESDLHLPKKGWGEAQRDPGDEGDGDSEQTS